MKKYCFKFEKLVRDKIPNFLRDNGVIVHEKILEKDLFLESLKEKLIEEAMEVKNAKSINELKEEFADVLEIFYELLNTCEIDFSEIENLRMRKADQKGGFKNKSFIHNIEMSDDNPTFQYYKGKTEQYPETD